MSHGRSVSAVPPMREQKAKEATPPRHKRRRSSAAWGGGAVVATADTPMDGSRVEEHAGSALLQELSTSSSSSSSSQTFFFGDGKDDRKADEPSVTESTSPAPKAPPRRVKKRRSLTAMVLSSRRSSSSSSTAKNKRSSSDGGTGTLKRSSSAKSRTGTLRSPRFDDNSAFNSISRHSQMPAKKHSEILNSSRYSRLGQNMQMHNSIFQQIARLVGGGKNQRPALEGAFDAPSTASSESKDASSSSSSPSSSPKANGAPTPASPYAPRGRSEPVFGGSTTSSEKEAHQDKAFEWFLEEAAARRYFASFLKKRKEVENLMLWADCKDFARVVDKQLRLERVKRINDRYVTKNARFRVKLDSAIAKRIQKANKVKRINDRYVTKNARFRVKLDSAIVKRIQKASKSYAKWVAKHQAAEDKRNAKLAKKEKAAGEEAVAAVAEVEEDAASAGDFSLAIYEESYAKWVAKHQAAEDKRNAKLAKKEKAGGEAAAATAEAAVEVEDDAASAGDFSLAVYEEAMEFVTAKLRAPFKDFLASPEYETYLRVAKRHHSYKPQNLNQISWQEVQDLVRGKNPALLQKDPSLFGQKLLEEGVPIKEVMRIVSAAKLRKQDQLDAARRNLSSASVAAESAAALCSTAALQSPSTSVTPSCGGGRSGGSGYARSPNSNSSSAASVRTRAASSVTARESERAAVPRLSNSAASSAGSAMHSPPYDNTSSQNASQSLSSTGAYIGSVPSPRLSVSSTSRSASGTDTPPSPYTATERYLREEDEDEEESEESNEDTMRELSRSADLKSVSSSSFVMSPTSAPGACEPSSLRRSKLKKTRSGDRDKTKSADITDMDPAAVFGAPSV